MLKKCSPENAVVKSCLQWLLLNGCFAWKNNTGGTKTVSGGFIHFGKTGSADIIGIIGSGENRGKFIAVECKYGKNKQSPAQIDFGNQVTQKGGIYIVAYSIDDLVGKI